MMSAEQTAPYVDSSLMDVIVRREALPTWWNFICDFLTGIDPRMTADRFAVVNQLQHSGRPPLGVALSCIHGARI